MSRRLVEDETVAWVLDRKTISDGSLHGGGGVVDRAEEVDIPRWTSERSAPGTQHYRAFDYEPLSPLRQRKPVEEPLDREVLQHLVVGFALRLGSTQ
jgi:hypothetical protein